MSAALRRLFPGLIACAVVAAAAALLAEHYGAPVMPFALLPGLAMNSLSDSDPSAADATQAARSTRQAVCVPVMARRTGGAFLAARRGTAPLGRRLYAIPFGP